MIPRMNQIEHWYQNSGRISEDFSFNFTYKYFLCVCLYQCTWCPRGQVIGSLEMELQVVSGNLIMVFCESIRCSEMLIHLCLAEFLLF